MKLDYDCLRAILLFIEENQTYESIDLEEFGDDLYLTPISSTQIHSALSEKYSKPEILYACKQADDAGLIKVAMYNSSTAIINEITYKGHEYIKVMRNDNVWNKVRQHAAKLGGLTLDLMFDLGVDYMKRLISGGV